MVVINKNYITGNRRLQSRDMLYCVFTPTVLNYIIKPLYYCCPHDEQEESSRLLNSAWFLSTGTRDDTSYCHHSNITVTVTLPISNR